MRPARCRHVVVVQRLGLLAAVPQVHATRSAAVVGQQEVLAPQTVDLLIVGALASNMLPASSEVSGAGRSKLTTATIMHSP